MDASCPSDARFIDMTPYINDILQSHNEKRNSVAGGEVPNHSPAVRMGTVQWDDELAYVAGLNVKTCQYGHDTCRNTDAFSWSGQNLAKNWWYGGVEDIQGLLLEQLDMWYDEYHNSDMSNINSVPENDFGKVTGHFTAMIHELSIRVGCASVRSSETNDGVNWETLTTACNYAHTNVIGAPIYIAGPTASECQTGTNPQYPNLCSTAENIDANTPLKL